MPISGGWVKTCSMACYWHAHDLKNLLSDSVIRHLADANLINSCQPGNSSVRPDDYSVILTGLRSAKQLRRPYRMMTMPPKP